jgi:hypothetical protein
MTFSNFQINQTLSILANIPFQALSLAVLGVWCLTIYRFRGEVMQCFGELFATSHRERDRIGSKRLYGAFPAVAMTLGAVSVGLAVVKVGATALSAGTGTPGTWQWRVADMAGTSGIAGIPSWVAPAVALVVALGVVCVVLVEVGILKMAGWVTVSGIFTRAIVQTKRNTLSAASMLLVPLVAVWSGVNPVRDTIVGYIIVAVAVALSVLFAMNTLRAFIRQKVSVLIWFLYLCTVEIFPLAAALLMVSRSV